MLVDEKVEWETESFCCLASQLRKVRVAANHRLQSYHMTSPEGIADFREATHRLVFQIGFFPRRFVEAADSDTSRA